MVHAVRSGIATIAIPAPISFKIPRLVNASGTTSWRPRESSSFDMRPSGGCLH